MFKGTPTDPRGEHPAGRGAHPSAIAGHLTAVPSPEPEAPEVFVKPAPPSDPLRRRSEAEVLQTLRHPGTVEVLGLKDGPEGTSLELAKLDAVDLLHHRALEPSELVVVFGQVCQTLGEIHSAGFVHGNLGAEHVLIDQHGRAVLCGFGNASPVRSDARPDGLEPQLDVAAIARLLDRELDRTESEYPGDRLNDSLRHIAQVADAHEVTKATASSLALRLHQLSNAEPSSSLAPDADPEGAATDLAKTATAVGGRISAAWQAHRLPALAGAAVVVALLVLAAARLVPDGARPDSATADAAPTTQPMPAPTTDGPPQQGAELVMAIEPACPTPPDAANLADVDGDGCPERWTASNGRIDVGSQRFTLGTPEDFAIVGDWNCDGSATPALVDATGRVFLFDQWPSAGQSVTVEATTEIDGVVSVWSSECGALDYETADGARHSMSTATSTTQEQG